jgi:lambda repressor-like predicted transcriptional regulator
MSAVRRQPAYEPTAAVLTNAIKAAGVTRAALAKATGASASTIGNMMNAKSPVNLKQSRAMAALLDLHPECLVSAELPHGNTGHGGRRRGAGKPGPAARAAALHAATTPAVNGEALPPAPRPTPILGMEILSDGNALVTMRITLPADRGAVLFRTLLDFGVTGT